MADFSLDLNEDQLQIQKWVHDFAEDVVRPAAHEWDEREETPWPIIEEAAKVGLYSMEFGANAVADPTGLTWPIVIEEMCWGDAGITLAIFGSTLAVSGIVANGTPEQIGEWVPQCFGTPEKIQLGAFCVSEPDAGSDVSSLRTRAVYDEAKDEWVLNGTKTWITNGGIADVHVVVASVDPELDGARPGELRGAAGHAGADAWARSSRSTASAPATPPRSSSTTCACPASCLLGGKEKLDERLARAREGASSRGQAAMKTFEATRPLVGAQAVGIARAAYEYSLDYAKERVQFGRPIIENQAIAFKLADMKTEIDASRLLVWRASWMGATRQAVRERRGLDEQAQGGRDRGVGHRGGDPDPRRLRLRARVPGRALAPRREDLHDLRGHLRDPAPRDRARISACTFADLIFESAGRPGSAAQEGSGASG